MSWIEFGKKGLYRSRQKTEKEKANFSSLTFGSTKLDRFLIKAITK